MNTDRHVEALEAQQQNLCARMEKMVGKGVGFERTRRITGYLVGTLDRFNNAKRVAERDRVRHG